MSQIGIDLGTTNTVAAVDRQVLGVGTAGDWLLPSVVAFPPSGVRLVGSEARRRKAIDPKNTIYSAKRLIGRGWYSADTAEFRRRYPFDLVEKEEGPAFSTRAGVLTPTEIATAILVKVGENRQAAALKSSARTVIAVPSMFGEAEKAATREAAARAGFTQVDIIDEPSATVAAYLGSGAGQVRYCAVYDFGGGTFDLAVVDCTVQPYRILAHDGDLYLGGDDIDFALANWVTDSVLSSRNWDLKSDQPTFQRLIVECERAKIRLGDAESVKIDLSQVDPAAPCELEDPEIDKATMTHIASDFIRRTFSMCDDVLRRAELTVDDLDAVYVAGGGGLLAPLRDGVEKYFRKKLRYAFNPLQIVAIGSSVVR